jgi:hypothetical protein
MTAIKTFVKSHPVLSYFALAFANSWGGFLLVIGGVGAIPGTAGEWLEKGVAPGLKLLAGSRIVR